MDVIDVFRPSLLEAVLHSGPTGIFSLVSMLAAVILGGFMAARGNSVVALSLVPVPIISGLMFYGYSISVVVLDILRDPGVRDPNWYFYITGEAGLFILIGGVLSLILIGLNIALLGNLAKKTC